jgi:mRNA degradation ribonuclease J1/J2
VVNTTLLAETARALSGDPGSTATTLGELRDIWREARPTLIVLMTPADFERLSAAIASARRGSPSELVALSRSLDSLTALLWEEHQAFILSPLLRYARGDTLSKKISQLLDRHTPSSQKPT